MDMKQWAADTVAAKRKKALPVLSFPAIQLMNVSVRELISSAETQARGMITVAERVDSAASVNLMDLSVEAECFGGAVRMDEGEVPAIVGRVVTSEEEARALAVPKLGAGRTGVYIDAVGRAAAAINDRPVLGGAIGPFSLAARLMGVSESMLLCYDEPDMVHILAEKSAEFIIKYISAFKAAGADGVVMAEPVAGLMSPELTEEFSSKYVKEIVRAVQDDGFMVVYHNCGGSTLRCIDSILDTGAMAFHFGNDIKMADMLPHIPKDRLCMGNVSPAGQFRNGTPESVRRATLEVMEACCGYDNFVISSGCDIPPLAPWENIDAFFAAVDEFYGAK